MKPTVTVIIPSYKVEGVLREVLASVYRQTYPIQKIILIDNHSPDRSVAVARKFASSHKKIPIEIIEREKTYGISDSYNLGAKLARTMYIVTVHSDGILPTKHELGRLMSPFLKDPTVVAAGPRLIHRKKEWLAYNFWQKCLFATSVGKEVPSGNGKFDCFNREVFLKAGGFDTKHFSPTLGSEDIDMHLRLRRFGRVVNTEARVIHAHPAESGYSMVDWISHRNFLALSYGRYIQLHFHDAIRLQYVFFVKPLLALITTLGFVSPVFFVPIVVFPFIYMPVMFRDSATNRDPRILVLPLLIMFLVFYESVWMAYSLLFMREAQYNKDRV